MFEWVVVITVILFIVFLAGSIFRVHEHFR